MLTVTYNTTRHDYETNVQPKWEESMRLCYGHECPGLIDPDTGDYLDDPEHLLPINFMIVNGRRVPYTDDPDLGRIVHFEPHYPGLPDNGFQRLYRDMNRFQF